MAVNKFFVEIGAANFDTLLNLAKQGWSGIVVEPVPYLSKELSTMFEGLDVHVYDGAISDFYGTVTMAVGENEGWLTGASHIIDDHSIGFKLSSHEKNKYRFQEKIQVKCITLDDLLKDIDHIDFMKVDVEGHELNIFRNYSFRVKPNFIKVEHKHVDDIELKSILEDKGYIVWTEPDDIYAVC